jgi:DNA-binding Xre family transcriptional regulator
VSARSVTYTWRLREVMAAQGVWSAPDLVPLLAERGVLLSVSQVYRLVGKTPERMTFTTLAALCDIFSCDPSELIGVGVAPGPRPGDDVAVPIDMAARRRPLRARVDPNR